MNYSDFNTLECCCIQLFLNEEKPPKCCFPSDSQSYLVLPCALLNACRLLFQRLTTKKEKMNFQSSRRRGEEGIAVVIDFLLSNARLVLGVGGAALLGIATLAVKRVSAF